MTPEETHRIAKEGAHEGVREAFMHFGVDITDADSVKAFQADLHFLGRQRKGAEEAGRWIRRAALGAFVSGLLWVLWEGLKHALSR